MLWPLCCCRRSSGSKVSGGRGGWEDEEDEDAFLDCLLQVGAAVGLRLR